MTLVTDSETTQTSDLIRRARVAYQTKHELDALTAPHAPHAHVAALADLLIRILDVDPARVQNVPANIDGLLFTYFSTRVAGGYEHGLFVERCCPDCGIDYWAPVDGLYMLGELLERTPNCLTCGEARPR